MTLTQNYHLTQTVEPMLRDAKVVLWDLRILQAATKGCEAFEGTLVTEEDVPAGPEYWTFSDDITFTDPDAMRVYELDQEYTVQGIIVLPAMELLEATKRYGRYVSPSEYDGRHGVALCFLLIPKRMPDVERGESGLPVVRFAGSIWVGDTVPGGFAQWIAARRFMNMPIVEQRRAEFNHADRKPYKRACRPMPEVLTIHLRRVQRPTGNTEQGGEREFGCHFLVGGTTGFWRKPKRWKDGRVGRPEYVHPYVKGDLTKPFKPPTDTVYVVKR